MGKRVAFLKAARTWNVHANCDAGALFYPTSIDKDTRCPILPLRILSGFEPSTRSKHISYLRVADRHYAAGVFRLELERKMELGVARNETCLRQWTRMCCALAIL